MFKQPAKFVDLGDYTKMSKAFFADWRAIDIQALLTETGFADKFDELPMEVLSMIESLNSFKVLFQQIKAIPEEPITYNADDPWER